MNATFELSAPIQIQGSALFSRERTIRREIRRWWVPGPKRWVAWLMTNPSDASEARNDPTAMRVTNFSRSWGYDGWIGVNLVPFISSTTPAMWKWFDWESNGPDWAARDDLAANLDDIERVGRLAALRVVAFGAEPVVRCPEWRSQCIEAFGQPSDIDGSETLHCIGETQSWEPKHPLARGKHRVPGSAWPVVWTGCALAPQ